MAHAMVGLGKWLKREEWREPLGQAVVEHLGAACDDHGIEIEALEDVVGQEAFIDAWGAACEDFFTRDLEDGRNFADDYLKRRGWKESPANREFIKGLRHSVVGLYEVTEVEPGRHFTVQDMILGGEPVQVDEPTRSRHVRLGDLLGARLFRVRQRMRTSEIILVFSRRVAAELQQSLEDLLADAKRGAPEIAAELGRPDDAEKIAELARLEVVLQGAAALFTDYWLRQVLAEVLEPPVPRLVNSDGEAIEFATAVYALAAGIGDDDLSTALAGLAFIENAPPPADEPPVEPDADNPYDGWTVTWHWVDEAAIPDQDAPEDEEEVNEDGVMRLNPKSPKGLPVLGDLSRKGDRLRLAANTATRLERGRALLEPALAGLVGAPEVEVRSMAEFLSDIVEQTRDQPER